MYHTSPEKISSINNDGVAGRCLFFSDDVYVMTASDIYYVYEMNEENLEFVRASQLYDEKIVAEIAEYFGCDEELAESLLDASEIEWLQEASWWLQGKRGECAVKMGYDGCEDLDEQGTVYIVPMLDRGKDLKLVEVVER